MCAWGRLANAVRARVDHEAQQRAHVEARAADQEIVGGVFAALVDAPRLAQPRAVRLEAARREHAAARRNALVARPRGHETRTVKLDALHRRFIADLHAELVPRCGSTR
jgi:hypothetical protein